VVGISRIEVQVSDKIEQGSSVPLSVNLFDTLGQPLDATVLPFIKLQSVLGSSIVRVKALEGLQHMVEGAALGETTIAFTTAAVRSPVVNIQVFAPLKLSPQNVTLVLGATLQVVTSGGPQPDTVVEFTLVESNIATCTSNGIVEGIRLGHSKLVARAVGIDRATGKQRIYSQDQVDVYVIRLSAIRIVSPLTRVRQNTEMPIYFMGLDENETPFSFGTCNPPLKVEWQLSDHLSGQVSGTLLHSGLNPLLGVSHFAARFKALAPGATTLRVRVTSQPNSGQLTHAELTDEISIQVYETLQLVSPLPPSSGSVLVMMPNTELDLRTNLDSSAGVEYVVGGVSDVVYPDGKGNIRSRASLGHASLIATATNNYGVAQSISALVEVSLEGKNN
jgi:nuclear pore complex protein Nup210